MICTNKALVVIDIENDITKHCRGYAVHVISDCMTSYDLKKMPELLACCTDKGCKVKTLAEYVESNKVTVR